MTDIDPKAVDGSVIPADHVSLTNVSGLNYADMEDNLLEARQLLSDVTCLHELVALLPVDERHSTHQGLDVLYATYRAFEVWQGNFEATCELLHDKDWLSDGVCPLVLSHFLLSKAQVASLPRYVPWRRVEVTVEEELEALRELLVEPLQVRGLICVDFADYAAALTSGGEIRMWRANGTTVVSGITKIVRLVISDESIFAQTAACCLLIRVPRPIGMEDLDQAILAIDSLLPEESFLVASVLLDGEGTDTFQISLMSVMAR